MKNFIYSFLSLLCFCFIGCQQPNSNNSTREVAAKPIIYERVSNEKFKNLIATKTNAQLIDVRTPAEYSEGYINEAQNINFYDDNFEAQLGQLDKNRPVLVYCRSGGRSQKACSKLKDMGFKEVYELANGYGDWEN